MYKKLDRERNGFLVKKPKMEKLPEVKKITSAKKEMKIVTEILTRDDQLNLLALIVEQLIDHVGLDTPETQYAKMKYQQIRDALNG